MGDIVPVLVDVDGVINAQRRSRDDLQAWPARTWREETGSVGDGASGRLTFSTGVVDGLRAIEALPGVRMMWCSTWLDRAPEVLAPILGIGADWPVLRPFAKLTRGPELRWKAVQARALADSCGSVVWLDDKALAWAAANRIAEDGDPTEWMDERVLVISPATRSGLTPDDLDAIEIFLGDPPTSREGDPA